MNNFDWKAIRPWKGTQSGGFEELCSQIARLERPSGAKFDRKGTPDAGVECFCVLADGTEWGWQAKFLFSLGANEMAQLDKSVKTALKKHPKLVRYFICMPLDRPDARIRGSTSALQRWQSHVKKWEGWAQERCMDVEFIWWGSSDLIDRLSRREHSGRLMFWFGQQQLDQDWFQLRIEEALEAAGPRYTPEIHVHLPIARDLERFSRSDLLFAEVKSLAIGIRRAREGLAYGERALRQRDDVVDLQALADTTDSILNALSHLKPVPTGTLPFSDISKLAQKASTEGDVVLERLQDIRRQQDATKRQPSTSRSYNDNPLPSLFHYLEILQSELYKLRSTSDRSSSLANSQLLILKGEGGSGKTHLLCDFARKRVNDQLPTVLLMGQRFLSEDDPWMQLLQQLDLPHSNAEEIVGALEAAAQASNCRALLIIDALNEGNGRRIWRPHLSAFLNRIKNSGWIAVALSVRTSYEETIIPEDVRERAVTVTHPGFSGQEYNAVKIFFDHYGLEFPSAPILQPEFNNPLFLKTICKGLRDSGERRVPRGFHGITAVFDLYLETINSKLASPEVLDYDSRYNLVRIALERLSERLSETKTRWLPLAEAQDVVNGVLPGQSYSKSLYLSLVAEGILVEDMIRKPDGLQEEGVFISYDRFADHIVADHLLRSHLDADDPSAAFSRNGGLAFLSDKQEYKSYGLLEALSIQVPESIGVELVRLAPELLNHQMIGQAFLQSLVWRKLDAFSKDTLSVCGEISRSESGRFVDPLETLLSISTVPKHPLNARYLDKRLRQDSMPDRDSWWSTFLHHAWGNEGSIDRLVDWATNKSADVHVDAEVVELASTTLAWMLTTPNRILRDRATKALVALLTGRLKQAKGLVARFANVDDPYVTERIYAVAYGVAMRSHDTDEVGELAALVYERVFASASPPPHILLRDYARGVVERAIHLGAGISINIELIRPPYKSTWPKIPSEDDIDCLTSGWGEGPWKGGDPEWSQNRIHRSVMDGILSDFGRYVIGGESNWLSLCLDEDAWQSPEQRTKTLLANFSPAEVEAYGEFKKIEKDAPFFLSFIRQEMAEFSVDESAFRIEQDNHDARLRDSRESLMSTLSDEHKHELESILQAKSDGPPRFNVRAIQRYVLWRVFDLGWTIERFGKFDRFSIGYYGRAANKPERMGKKYQWIAFHEILAHIADQFQYRMRSFSDEDDHQYEGPWQEFRRDIDPSCVLRSTVGGTSWGPHTPAWWGKEIYDSWREDASHQEWLADTQTMPDIGRLLEVVNPKDGTRWLNANGSFVWKQPYPPDQGAYDQEGRQLQIQLTAYFVPAHEANSFISWAKTVNFWGGWMPEPFEISDVFLGEYGWAPAFKYSIPYDEVDGRWTHPKPWNGSASPTAIQPASMRYFRESGGFDCSLDDTFALLLPQQDLIDNLNLQWSNMGADFRDAGGNLAAFDPTAHENGPTALLLSKIHLEDYLKKKGLALCWIVIGEKLVVGGDDPWKHHGRLEVSGAYLLEPGGPAGYLKAKLILHNDNSHACEQRQSFLPVTTIIFAG